MNDTGLVQKVWNYAHVLRDQGVPYQAYISQISYLLFLKMMAEQKREEGSIPNGMRWRDLFAAPLAMSRIFSRGLRVPCITRTSITTPT